MKLLITIAFALSLVIANAATTNYMDTLVVTNLYMPVTSTGGPIGNYTKAYAGTLELNQNVGATGPYIIFKSIDLNPLNTSYTTSVFFSTGGANGYGPYFASDIGVQGNIYCLGTVYAATNILWQTNIVWSTNAFFAVTATNTPDGNPIPWKSGTNVWSGTNTFTGTVNLNGPVTVNGSMGGSSNVVMGGGITLTFVNGFFIGSH